MQYNQLFNTERWMRPKKQPLNSGMFAGNCQYVLNRINVNIACDKLFWEEAMVTLS